MITEKTEPVAHPTKKPKFEQIRADHELFLQAFEKPTQIYRFLATRNAVAPIFLHRTLAYMKHLRTPRKKNRNDFKLDSMLEKLENKTDSKPDPSEETDGYLNLTFSSFFFVNGDLSGNKKRRMLEQDFVKVEVSLVKICHKKRKDSELQVDQVSLGEGVVPFNPRSQLLPLTSSSSVTIPNTTFKASKAYSKTCLLTLQVAVPYKTPIKGNKGRPPKKKDSDESEGQEQQDYQTEHTTYFAELIMFDNHRHCLLTDGEYELVLQEKYKRPGRKRGLLSNKSSWENVFNGNMGPFDIFAYGPTLKFKLSWSGTPVVSQRPTSLPLHSSHNLPSATESPHTPSGDSSQKEKTNKAQILYYQFIYNSHTRQQTEARHDFCCPWCHVNCSKLYNLLKHLKLCHSRFTFTYAPHSKGARIDVCVNEHYDGKMEGVNDALGYAFSREGPCRRVPFNHVLAWRPQRRKESLSEFLEPDDADENRPYHSGYTRTYFHSSTCVPISQSELGSLSDSEGEENPLWMRMRTIQMIDDFTDVNDGEKELMKLWNLHLMEKGYVADAQVYSACLTFIDVNAKKIMSQNLKRNFLIHLVSLHDFNLLNGGQIFQLMQKLKDVANETKQERNA
ncbi:predicted protein, partial [Nematostella vectensis]